MATPLTADQLVKALKAEGLVVHEVPGWRTHNRNAKGAWGPVNGVMLHHTASDSAGIVDYCFNGTASLPGPLAHGVIDKKGEVWLIGNGRANHAGGGDPKVLAAVTQENYGTAPPATHEHEGSSGSIDGNSHFYGFECVNRGDGSDPWPAVQIEAMTKASAAIIRAHRAKGDAWGLGGKSVIGHLEWSDWKSDPKGASLGTPVMPTMRTRVAACLKLKAGAWKITRTTQPAPAPAPTLEQRVNALEKAVSALEAKVK